MAEHRCIDVLYEHVSRYIPLTKEQYAKTLDGWDLSEVSLGDIFAGVLMMRGHEIHVCLDSYLCLKRSRELIRMLLINKLKSLGYLTTVALKNDEKSNRFIKRLGFYITQENEQFIFYRIENTRFH